MLLKKLCGTKLLTIYKSNIEFTRIVTKNSHNYNYCKGNA